VKKNAQHHFTIDWKNNTFPRRSQTRVMCFLNLVVSDGIERGGGTTWNAESKQDENPFKMAALQTQELQSEKEKKEP
jgi:hypothetical protein